MLARLVPKQDGAPFDIPLIGFVCALVGAPLVVAFLGFWILLIPVFALYYGGPAYLICAGPTLYYFLRRRAPDTIEIMLLALVVNTVLFLFLLGLNTIIQIFDRTSDILVLYGGFGSLMSAIWGATFAKLYVWFTESDDE